MTRACKDCSYFQEIRYRGGQCRFEPPKENDGRSQWPSVQRDDWCGRFVTKDSTVTGVDVLGVTIE